MIEMAHKTNKKHSLGELIWVISVYVAGISFAICIISWFIFYITFTQYVLAIRISLFSLFVWAISFVYSLFMADDYIDVDKIGEIPKKRKKRSHKVQR